MAVELDQIEALVAIVRGGGFTRAAAALHLSQPAVSRRLQLLERELGAPLFERLSNGVFLTEAGTAFLPHAEALLASMRDGIDAVRGSKDRDRGVITLALVGTLASTTLTESLRAFRERYPLVQLQLRTALSREVSTLVRRGDATLGLRYGADRDPDMVSAIVHDEPRVVVCSPRHRLARARAVGPRGRTRGALRRLASAVPGGLWLGRSRSHRDRQPHGAKAHGRGWLWPGAASREQRRRGAARRHAADPARSGDACHDAGCHGPSPTRVSERRRPPADGPPRVEPDAAAASSAAIILLEEARRQSAPAEARSVLAQLESSAASPARSITRPSSHGLINAWTKPG